MYLQVLFPWWNKISFRTYLIPSVNTVCVSCCLNSNHLLPLYQIKGWPWSSSNPLLDQSAFQPSFLWSPATLASPSLTHSTTFSLRQDYQLHFFVCLFLAHLTFSVLLFYDLFYECTLTCPELLLLLILTFPRKCVFKKVHSLLTAVLLTMQLDKFLKNDSSTLW